MNFLVSERNIRILGISGSPRKKATDYAVSHALEYASENYSASVEYFSAKGKTINFCIHCDYCIRKKEGCVFKDDLTDLYDKMIWADAWIIGTPVYQGNVSGQTKVIIDRCRAVVARNPNVFRNKVGIGVSNGGDRTGGQEPALKTIHDFYIINEMIPIGGGAFGANLGGTFWSKDKGKEGIENDEVGMKSLYRTIDRMIEVSRTLIDC